MRLLVDGFIYTFQQFGGVNRYFDELLERLPESVRVFVAAPPGTKANENRRNTTKLSFDVGRFGFAWRRFEPWYFRQLVRATRPDLLHPTYYDHYLEMHDANEALRSCPMVLTVYDFIMRRYPERYPDGVNVCKAQSRAIERADAVICISESTRRDLLECFPDAKGKCSVIPLAASASVVWEMAIPDTDDAPFFVFVGSRAWYKGFKVAVQALCLLRDLNPKLCLKVVGAPMTAEELELLLEVGAINRVQFLGSLNDCQLARLYAGSQGLLYPSLYEGFGIPPLEAMQCGAPVIACDTSSIPEVVRGAALLVTPGAADELAEAMRLVVEDSEVRRRLILAGRQQAKSFSWVRTADETYRVYRQVTGKN